MIPVLKIIFLSQCCRTPFAKTSWWAETGCFQWVWKPYLTIEEGLISVPFAVKSHHLISPVLSNSARWLMGLCLSRNIMCLTSFSEEQATSNTNNKMAKIASKVCLYMGEMSSSALWMLKLLHSALWLTLLNMLLQVVHMCLLYERIQHHLTARYKSWNILYYLLNVTNKTVLLKFHRAPGLWYSAVRFSDHKEQTIFKILAL